MVEDIVQVNASGYVEMRVGFVGESTESLGYALDQVRCADQPFWIDVHGDQHGGPEGPPIEIQMIGKIVKIRGELSRFNRTVANKIRRLAAVNAANNVNDAAIGALMFQGLNDMRVWLSSSGVDGSDGEPRFFKHCIPREPIEQGYGTKFSTLIVEFEAHRDQTTGVIESATS